MIYLIIQLLREHTGIKVPMVFSYYSTRMMLAAITSLVFSIYLGPWFIRKLYELKIGQSIRTEDCPLLGKLHEKKKDTPTMGGILILSSMLISLFLWMDLKHIFTLILCLTTLVLGFLGGYDDYLKLKYHHPRGLAARKKLWVQVILGGVLALYFLNPTINQAIHQGSWFSPPVIKEYVSSKPSSEAFSANPQLITLKDYASRLYIPFFKDPLFSFSGLSIVLAGLLIVFVVTGSSNAVNLTDGLDGLAAGCLLMVSMCLAAIAFVSNHLDLARYLHILYIEGSGEIAIYLCALCGACLGFLWYNCHPAQVFMGDTGSLALGGVIGVSAILLKKEILLGIVGGIFVAEALSVILQVGSYRYRNKQRIFLCTPLHHHFEYKGWPETKIVIRFWIIGLLLAIIGLASIKFQ
jgi:phospho-N-acetylmuramoyl-pentapeptide-transferase